MQVADCIGFVRGKAEKKYTISLDIKNSGVNLIIKYVQFEVERTINFLIKWIVLVV